MVLIGVGTDPNFKNANHKHHVLQALTTNKFPGYP